MATPVAYTAPFRHAAYVINIPCPTGTDGTAAGGESTHVPYACLSRCILQNIAGGISVDGPAVFDLRGFPPRPVVVRIIWEPTTQERWQET